MVEPSCLERFLVQEARDLDVRLRAFPQQLFLRLRAQFGGAVGDEMLDGVDRFIATPLEDARREGEQWLAPRPMLSACLRFGIGRVHHQCLHFDPTKSQLPCLYCASPVAHQTYVRMHP